MSAATSLSALFISAFSAATLLPGGSELVFAGVLTFHPEHALLATLIAALGNTLGGMTTYLLARLFPSPKQLPYLGWVKQYGSVALILSWAPIIGDALCVAAGLLRLSWFSCLLWMGLGKTLRYIILAWLITIGMK